MLLRYAASCRKVLCKNLITVTVIELVMVCLFLVWIKSPDNDPANTRLQPNLFFARDPLRGGRLPRRLAASASTFRPFNFSGTRAGPPGDRARWVGFPELQGSRCNKVLEHKQFANNEFDKWVKRPSNRDIRRHVGNCTAFVDRYGFRRYPEATQEERDFPIAYIFLFHRDLDQVLFLLRAVYFPHNAYCLNVDTASGSEFIETVRMVARCLPNVFLASKQETIVYSGFTRLQSDVNCMEDLGRHPVQWKYALNLVGQMFPLRTNLEMVRILTLYNGANDVEGILGRRMISGRFRKKHFYRNDTQGRLVIRMSHDDNPPPPHRFEVVKGSAFGTFSRAFVQFVLHNQTARDLLEWSKGVSSPDEYFWSTLHHSKTVNVPGRYIDGPADKKPWLSSFSSWGGQDSCATFRIRGICIFSPEDIPLLLSRHELLANKFYITHHPAALHCLDKMLFNLTWSRHVRNLDYYRTLPFLLRTGNSFALTRRLGRREGLSHKSNKTKKNPDR